ncbi:MAG: fibronectin type III domain-containing protein, partial [Ferruginibacter sp.]|nr:fibronectin type III domain-containing protein [Cytophagales bacterium]
MKSPLQKFSSSKWQRCLALAARLFLLLTASPAQAEPPHAQLRPFAPGGIAIDWEHPNDGAASVTVERQDPAFTWVFTALVNSFNDLGLQPSRVYRYRVCANYAQATDCTPWLAAQTLATPPPPAPPTVPSFTTTSSTSNSITVNWTSSPSYSFHQVRWAENGHGDGQNRVNGRSFTVDGLRPGTYHFIVQGCNRTLLGSSCSRFSTPIEVTTRVPVPPSLPPPAAAKGVIYGVTLNDDLMWYRHDGRNDGSFRWAFSEGKKVGNGWNFKQVFSGGDGVIYAILANGDLMWYRHDGRNDGSIRWAFNEGKKIGNGWNFKQMFSGGDGVIYAITANNDLMWYRHEGRNDGSVRWAFNEGKKIGNG